ncbi:MAG: AAA family ATPase [Actinomycetota bacterium]|nr:AAA family ATPase [Actinomycetota bacterium]
MVAEAVRTRTFVPQEPVSLQRSGLSDSEVEGLILKFLAARGDASGFAISEQIKLPYPLTLDCLTRLKDARLVGYRGSASMNDFVYQITDHGRDTARRLAHRCTYFGAAPVSLEDYVDAVVAQGITDRTPTPGDLAKAFDDLVLDAETIDRLGPAIASGQGMFLFGPSGNGKTSIAQRITRSLGGHIWVPRAIGIDGEIVRIFDPHFHVEVPFDWEFQPGMPSPVDQRWVLIERPTVAVGGELTMDQLEVSTNPHTGISEAPLQLKANGGTLVIDDFGRQRMRTDDLLNRWIVPLEAGYDFYSLSSGRRIQMPFQQVIAFSTNLEPRDLVDEAFLRRIPYKIPVGDPSEGQFRELFETVGAELGVRLAPGAVDHVVSWHYRRENKPFRFCHPRDLLLQVLSEARFRGVQAELSEATADRAVDSYFSVI